MEEEFISNQVARYATAILQWCTLWILVHCHDFYEPVSRRGWSPKRRKMKRNEPRSIVIAMVLSISLHWDIIVLLYCIGGQTAIPLCLVLGGWFEGKPFVCWQLGGDHWWQSCNRVHKVHGWNCPVLWWKMFWNFFKFCVLTNVSFPVLGLSIMSPFSHLWTRINWNLAVQFCSTIRFFTFSLLLPFSFNL